MEKNNISEHLNEINKTQTGAFTSTSRLIMTSVFAANIAVIIKDGHDVNLCNIVTCISVVIYFACELTHYYMGALMARKLLKEIIENNKDFVTVEKEMNETSALTFSFLQIKSILLVIAILFQLYYFGLLIFK